MDRTTLMSAEHPLRFTKWPLAYFINQDGITYLRDKVVREADKAADAKQYTQQNFEKWKL